MLTLVVATVVIVFVVITLLGLIAKAIDSYENPRPRRGFWRGNYWGR